VDQAQGMLIEDAKVLKGAISREVHRALRTQFLRRPSAGPAIVVSQGIGSLFFFGGGQILRGICFVSRVMKGITYWAARKGNEWERNGLRSMGHRFQKLSRMAY
jgi:hypothetical protein